MPCPQEADLRKADTLKREETVDLLNKCWMTHDGMWFLHCFQAFGIDQANKINKRAIKSLAAIEIARVKAALAYDQPNRNFDGFKSFFKEVSALIIPEFMNVTFSYPGRDRMAWAFQPGKCFAYAGIKRIGAIEGYECGVLYRVRCWLDELGIKHRFTPEIGKCHMHRGGTCSGEIELFFDEE
jgi:hypothetical protein